MEPSPPSRSILLQLPGELRNHIYELALSDDMHTCIHDMLHECALKSKARIPSLLQVNRQIRTEAASLWFTGATFQYHNMHQVERWLKALGEDHRGQIRTIRRRLPHCSEDGVRRDMTLARSMFRKMEMLSASRTLVLRCAMDQGGVVESSDGVWFRGPGEIGSDVPVRCEVVAWKGSL